uniref:Uncharacterized protein n=1 Tax=Candidatus Kentrum sp. FW TaxID=2126338 RepID=A0A450TN51_9GAMM|nr:MAG: hypothetical protein BECKFW1821B_GA0114236_11613 [Candidatus Kentron sp. FW]
MPFPFEVPFEEVERDIDLYVDTVFSRLQSEFLGLPKGPDFIEYPVFECGYEALKKATGNFRELSPEPILEAVYQLPIALTVLAYHVGAHTAGVGLCRQRAHRIGDQSERRAHPRPKNKGHASYTGQAGRYHHRQTNPRIGGNRLPTTDRRCAEDTRKHCPSTRQSRHQGGSN